MTYLVISNRRIDNASYFKNPAELEAALKVMHTYGTVPEVLIFAFWSWIVPKDLLDNYKCYGMHTGPLLEGKGKGGSPIDNLQRLGVKWTTLCVFEMAEKLDAGRVILAVPLMLMGLKEVVIQRIDLLIPDAVRYITADQPNIPETFRRLPDAR